MDEHLADSQTIPFSFFVSLLQEISKTAHRKTRKPSCNSNHSLQILEIWIVELRRRYSPLPKGTTATIFCLLFPEEDVRRKYDMQETRLAQELAKCIGISVQGRGDALKWWNGENSLGCLGEEVKKVIEKGSSEPEDYRGYLSIAEINSLLDELASISAFSEYSIRNTRSSSSIHRPRQAILRDLYRSMPAHDASYLTQIILKDLRPLLCPLLETHYTAALKNYNTKSMISFTKEDAMRAWDPSGYFLKTFKVRACLREAANMFESREIDQAIPSPRIGIPVQIPKSVKGSGCVKALKHFANADIVWAETKYDGERAQIHVEVRDDGSPYITIFSKSMRDSTMDRYGIHDIIRDALCLTKHADPSDTASGKIAQNVILDAEMVAFSDSDDSIDEFWRIRSLISSTARGPRRRIFATPKAPIESHEEPGTQASLLSNASDNGTRHLALVFFDILLLDSTSLLSSPYSHRRSVLASVIKTTPGYVMLSERVPIRLVGSQNEPAEQLRTVWSRIISRRDEGLVLKAGNGRYNDCHSPWVKLKKDYIPGYGDAVDFPIIAASWDKDRGRELRVAPTTYTTFYVGVLANAGALKKDPCVRPHFEVYFTVSYGLTRDELEEANFLVKNSDPLTYKPTRNVPKDLPYTYNLHSGLAPPSVIFKEPLVAELVGANFTKAPQCKYYELRFPRMMKLYRPSDRCWKSAVNLQELHNIARDCVGRDRSTKEADDWAKQLWLQTASPGLRSEKKRKEREEEWVEKLRRVDGLNPTTSKRAKCLTKTLQAKTAPAAPIREVLGDKPLGLVHNLATNPAWRSLRWEIAGKEEIPVVPPASLAWHPLRSLPPILDAISPTWTPLRSAAAICKRGFELQLGGPISSPLPTCRQQPPPSSTKHDEGLNPMIPFIRDALVYFARCSKTPRPPWRVSSKHLMTRTSRVHTLESLLAGCGWQGAIVPSKKTHGIIFVDETTEHGRDWKRYALETLGEKHSQLVQKSGYLPIWVFEERVLAFETLLILTGKMEDVALQIFS